MLFMFEMMYTFMIFFAVSWKTALFSWTFMTIDIIYTNLFYVVENVYFVILALENLFRW